MNDDLHAVIIGVIIGVSVFAIVLWRETSLPRKHQMRWRGWCVVIVIGVAVVHYMASTHMWTEPPPSRQLVIVYGLGIAALVLARRSAACILVALLCMSAWILQHDYERMILGGGYTADVRLDDRRWDAAVESVRTFRVTLAREDGMHMDKQYSPGPIPNELMAIIERHHSPGILDEFELTRTRWRWHSWLTGLYRVQRYRGSLWSAGGSYREVISTLEVRPKEMTIE